jgi:hypothetical protein
MLGSARLTVAFLAACTLLAASRADAGCGCDKPPPPPAAIRPAFASPGDTVTLFSSSFEVGRTYSVNFRDDGDTLRVDGVAVLKRDLADGVAKPQVSVRVPQVSPGPTRVTVKKRGDAIMRISSSDFTVLQPPLVLNESNSVTIAKCYSAAVGADGTVYIPLDITAIAQRMVFSGLGKSYPLLFSADGIAIYNTQGFLMQLLGPKEAGIFAIDDPGTPDSFQLTYDRHEFQTYRSQHVHQGALALDPNDPSWHLDGSRHVDHDHLVIAISGIVEGRGRPGMGQTPTFDLRVATLLADAPSSMSTRKIRWGSGWGCDNN